MKTFLLALILNCILAPVMHAAEEAKGFLVFTIERYTYPRTRTNAGRPSIEQSFKVPLTEFMSQFKNLPSQNSMGTGFYCTGGNLKSDESSTRFMWWIHRTGDHRWSINMWGKGLETVEGVKLGASNPTASQYLTIRELQDLDMSYQLSYNGRPGSGIYVSFAAKYVGAKDTNILNAIPVAPVKRTDGSELFKGDDQGWLPMGIRCGFQDD